jgi:hypothetical protein
MITVTPDTFTKVKFSADEIVAVVEKMLELVPGVDPSLDVQLAIAEDEPTTRVSISSLDPVVFEVDSGALENTRDPRTFGEEMASNSIGRLLFEYLDRTDGSFGAPPLGEPTDLRHRSAWAVYCYGRVSRLGVRVYRPKHLYDFRNRLGFSDAADAVFDRLWAADGLVWSDIDALATSTS